MPFTFDVIGWQDKNGNRHRGGATKLDDTEGVIVRVTDTNTGGAVEHFTVYGPTLQTWAEWWVLVAAIMEEYGFDLADDQPEPVDDGGGYFE